MDSLIRLNGHVRGRLSFFLVINLLKIPSLMANSIDSDQTPFMATDLGLHCLRMSLYGYLDYGYRKKERHL